MPYQEPVAGVVATEDRGDSVQTDLRIISFGTPGWLHPPLTPASLVALDEPEREVFQLHRLRRQSGDRLSYLSYEVQSPLPEIGAPYILRLWWDQSQLDIVLDRNTHWIRQPYPHLDPGSHDHCQLTWATIAANAEHSEGYHSHHGWLSVEAYERYIVHDILRLRR